MNAITRIKMLKAMEYICRQINNEDIFYYAWLTCGVADGDIEYGDLTVRENDMEDLEFYIEDDNFKSIIGCFLRCMKRAAKEENGGLYVDNIVATEEDS